MSIEIVEHETLSDAQIAALGAMCARAFATEAWANTMVCGRKYDEAPELWNAYFENTIAASVHSPGGRIYTIGEADAVLTVFLPGYSYEEPKGSVQNERLMKALESEPDHSRFYFGPGGEQMKQASDKAHPNEAHKKAWHCRALAVDPSQQGKGYGSALVRHVLAKARQGKQQAVIEAAMPANASLYQHLGFEVVGETDVKYITPQHPGFHSWYMRTPEVLD